MHTEAQILAQGPKLLVESVALSDSQASAAASIWIDIKGLEKSTRQTNKYTMYRLEPAKKNVDPMIGTRYFKDWDKLCLLGGVHT